MKVFLSEIAETKLSQLSSYLLENWGQKTRTDFFKRLTKRLNQISSHPESCPKSEEFGGIYKCVVTKQTTLYYRILKDVGEIEIITVFDSRQYPNTLQKEL